MCSTNGRSASNRICRTGWGRQCHRDASEQLGLRQQHTRARARPRAARRGAPPHLELRDGLCAPLLWRRACGETAKAKLGNGSAAAGQPRRPEPFPGLCTTFGPGISFTSVSLRIEKRRLCETTRPQRFFLVRTTVPRLIHCALAMPPRPGVRAHSTQSSHPRGSCLVHTGVACEGVACKGRDAGLRLRIPIAGLVNAVMPTPAVTGSA